MFRLFPNIYAVKVTDDLVQVDCSRLFILSIISDIYSHTALKATDNFLSTFDLLGYIMMLSVYAPLRVHTSSITCKDGSTLSITLRTLRRLA